MLWRFIVSQGHNLIKLRICKLSDTKYEGSRLCDFRNDL